jgi:hypothetical protein
MNFALARATGRAGFSFLFMGLKHGLLNYYFIGLKRE